MNSWFDNTENEALALRYIEALEEGQMDKVASILRQAENSPALWVMLEEVNDALYEEESEQIETSTHIWRLAFADEQTSAESGSPTQPTNNVGIAQPSAPEALSFLPNKRNLAWFSLVLLCVGILGLWSLLAPFNPGNPVNPLTRTKEGKQTLATQLQMCTQTPSQSPKEVTESWVEKVHHQPQLILETLTEAPMDKDLLALRENQHISQVMARHISHETLSQEHRAIRARLYLRMAKFHKKNYQMALSLNQDVYQKRLERASSLHLGRYFHYYWGRLLCLQGKQKAAVVALKKALKKSQSSRRDRIRAWLSACGGEAISPNSPLTFDRDPDGWAEWLLLQHIFHKPTTHIPKLRTMRAKLYAKVRRGQPVQWPSQQVSMPVDVENIEENGIKAKLYHYDPAIYLMISHSYAQQALSVLERVSSKDRYVSFYIAEAQFLLGYKKRAFRSWLSFLTNPPKKFRGAYFFFSHRLSIRSLTNEACYYQARLLSPDHPQLAYRILGQLGRQPFPTRSLAGLGLIQLKRAKKQSYQWIQEGVKVAYLSVRQLQQRYSLSAIQNQSPRHRQGAQIVSQLSLYKYQVRSMLLWGSMGALLMKQGTKATDWLERLHQKQTPYKIAGENEPLQLSWTTRAYIKAGKPGIASLFLSKNIKAYPSLTQLWALLQVWRIDEGMDSVPRVKG